ncbi:hypothetical protein MVLG_01456 [Microbotryum lychnidis-dioicae p1A1 Lamole]|uniref:DUF659 domain-containing protein n=1 Tax=Microbotryum lychnidis-dioicae (strain p1A1 Lamole / MvSl-1064) TaxID=683840 RepID=U5H266_USTV1|nr:hypothetical protein MVLG_01456 [Microbotryum lychnidis-dioicae p1A1 Lamole]|eukprot:KDE08421.1 hypothetical protein MVLG_01456 [Microbotryum lychnidis-dioicae p1A1 Lamole]
MPGIQGGRANTNVQPLLSAAIFDNALFMLSIVLHVAISKESFTHVDPQLQTWLAYSYHVANVNAILGSHDTVKRILVHLQRKLSVQFGEFLVKRNRGIHLVIDGWSAPSCISALGVVVVYEQDGVVHRHILKFIESKGRHVSGLRLLSRRQQAIARMTGRDAGLM